MVNTCVFVCVRLKINIPIPTKCNPWFAWDKAYDNVREALHFFLFANLLTKHPKTAFPLIQWFEGACKQNTITLNVWAHRSKTGINLLTTISQL